jgi:regulator of sirC expression with transglutaminase-like and TPR domain
MSQSANIFFERNFFENVPSMRSPLKIVLSLARLFLASVPGAHAGSDLLVNLAKLEHERATLCAATRGGSDLLARIDVLVSDLRSRPGITKGGPESVAALNRFIFHDLGIQASRDLKDPCNLLTSGVLSRKRGYCVGIAALYLALAERLGLPTHAVATPSHVFLRYDDGSTRINIETFQNGAGLSDEHYIREHRIPERSTRGGVFMSEMTTDEFLAQVHNNLGVIHSERKEFEAAAIEYDRALDLDPWLPAAYYNYGKDLLLQGDPRRAVRYFSKSLRLYPTDVWALNDRGLAYMKMEKREKARRDFEEALRIESGFEQAKRNLEEIPPLR